MSPVISSAAFNTVLNAKARKNANMFTSVYRACLTSAEQLTGNMCYDIAEWGAFVQDETLILRRAVCSCCDCFLFSLWFILKCSLSTDCGCVVCCLPCLLLCSLPLSLFTVCAEAGRQWQSKPLLWQTPLTGLLIAAWLYASHIHTLVPREGHRRFISYASRGRQHRGWIQSIFGYLIREAAHRLTQRATHI